MANYIDVTLSSGEVVRVYAPPSIKIGELVEKKFPLPQPPIVVDKTVTGKEIHMVIEDDPAYLAERERVEALRDRETKELSNLFILKDVQPPDGFDIEAEMGEILRYSDPDWQPREGKIGRKLDYIEWVLLANFQDEMKVGNALLELVGMDQKAVTRIEDSFRGDVERSPDPEMAATPEG